MSLVPATVALAFFVAVLPAGAQQVAKTPRIGVVFLGSASTEANRAEIVREASC